MTYLLLIYSCSLSDFINCGTFNPAIFNYTACLHLLCFSLRFSSRALPEQAPCSAGDAGLLSQASGVVQQLGPCVEQLNTELQVGQKEEKGGLNGEKN